MTVSSPAHGADFPAADALIVLTTAPDADSARALAEAALAERLVACVTQLAPAVSTYRWQGKVERTEEIPLLLKTCRACYPALQALLHELHPYELPEILAFTPTDGLPAWLSWLRDETSPS